jgi:hypothetical protein
MGEASEALTFNTLLPPAHTVFGVAVVLAMVGVGFIETATVDGAEVQPFSVAVNT